MLAEKCCGEMEEDDSALIMQDAVAVKGRLANKYFMHFEEC